jgi:hypothetical protein
MWEMRRLYPAPRFSSPHETSRVQESVTWGLVCLQVLLSTTTVALILMGRLRKARVLHELKFLAVDVAPDAGS